MEPVELFRQCNGCSDCELACSFRATGTFWRPASAIRVLKQSPEKAVKYRIEVDAEDCDLCSDEQIPQCQVVCRSGALTPDNLRVLRLQPASSRLH